MALAREYDYITYKEYLKYTKNVEQKTEYSDGEIFYMAPTHPRHNKVQNRLYMELIKSLDESCGCEVYTSDVAVKFEKEEEEHQFEPDVMVLCDDNFDGSIYKGIPKLIIEVLSKATKSRDTGIKLQVYEKFNVNEYWIVNIDSEEITVYSNNINGKYNDINTYTKNIEFIWNKRKLNIENVFK